MTASDELIRLLNDILEQTPDAVWLEQDGDDHPPSHMSVRIRHAISELQADHTSDAELMTASAQARERKIKRALDRLELAVYVAQSNSAHNCKVKAIREGAEALIIKELTYMAQLEALVVRVEKWNSNEQAAWRGLPMEPIKVWCVVNKDREPMTIAVDSEAAIEDFVFSPLNETDHGWHYCETLGFECLPFTLTPGHASGRETEASNDD